MACSRKSSLLFFVFITFDIALVVIVIIEVLVAYRHIMAAIVLKNRFVQVVRVALEEQRGCLMQTLEIRTLLNGRDRVLEEEWNPRLWLEKIDLLGPVEGTERYHTVLELV